MPILTVAAVYFEDAAGRVLTVRKRGTEAFMLPGGKLEPNESAAAAAVREIGEEIGAHLDEADLRLLGTWRSAPANEGADTVIVGTVFSAPPLREEPVAAGEIAESRWVHPADAAGAEDIAPLLRDHVLPHLAARRG